MDEVKSTGHTTHYHADMDFEPPVITPCYEFRYYADGRMEEFAFDGYDADGKEKWKLVDGR